MKIPGWTYIVIGVIIAAISGYIYKSIPKNGEPNMAMAFFFFIGMIFILVGVIKFFFIKMDNDQDVKYSKAQQEFEQNKHQHHAVHAPDSAHSNRVEAQMNRIYAQSNQNAQQSTVHHSNQYAASHPYHQTQATQQAQPAQPTHHISNNPTNSMPIIQCKKCGNKNHAAANYCHNCGHGLK